MKHFGISSCQVPICTFFYSVFLDTIHALIWLYFSCWSPQQEDVDYWVIIPVRGLGKELLGSTIVTWTSVTTAHTQDTISQNDHQFQCGVWISPLEVPIMTFLFFEFIQIFLWSILQSIIPKFNLTSLAHPTPHKKKSTP